MRNKCLGLLMHEVSVRLLLCLPACHQTKSPSRTLSAGFTMYGARSQEAHHLTKQQTTRVRTNEWSSSHYSMILRRRSCLGSLSLPYRPLRDQEVMCISRSYLGLRLVAPRYHFYPAGLDNKDRSSIPLILLILTLILAISI